MAEDSFVLPHDMSDLCRVCLQLPEESQRLDLSTIYDEEENLTYDECFTICTKIELKAGEDVPHNLCKSCGLELQMCYDFYKKIEESKKIIAAYQGQVEVQKVNEAKLMPDDENLKNLHLKNDEKRTIQLINEKYVINEESLQEDCENVAEFAESANIKYETDEIDILENMSPTETRSHPTTSEVPNPAVKTISKSEVTIEVADHLEMEDYQNLETLEEEETETLQLNCADSTEPMYVTKLKTLENGESEEVEEIEEVEEVEEFMEEYYDEEQEREDLDVNYTEQLNEEEYTDDHLKWQENVVAVANKEHLPIESESDDYMANKDKNNENEHENTIVMNDSAEEEICVELDTPEDESKARSKSQNKVRKRHVGSYSCDFCHRVYPNYSRMKTHRLCHEANRPKFSCSQCGRMYATKQARDCHIQTAHEKSGFSCSICGKVFAIRKSLEIHVRYHTGDFPFACELCDRKFAQVCHLNTHINVKHNKIRFSCDYPNCGKYFTSSSSLRNHEYTHSVMPFECEYCQQGYPAKAKLRIHIHRKHGISLNYEQLEKMRKFHVMRSKVNFVQFVDK